MANWTRTSLIVRGARLAVALALLVALVGIPGQIAVSQESPATGFVPGQTVEVNTDALNLRAAPELGAEVLAVMPGGTWLTVLDGPVSADEFTWYQVNASDYGVGWSAGELLSIVTTPSPDFGAGATVVVDTDALNLRDSAGLAGAVIAVLTGGALATVLSGPVASDGFNWYQLQTDVGTGWSAGAFLVAADEPPPPPPDDFAIGDNVVVASDALSLRAEASLSAGVLAVMPLGTPATVVGGPVSNDGFVWYQIDTADFGTGWSVGAFLAPATDPPPPPPNSFNIGDAVAVGVDALNLRSSADVQGSVIAVMPSGTAATVVDGPVVSGDFYWYQLDTPYGVGWSAGDFLVPAGAGGGDIGIGSTVQVAADGLNFRAGPSLSAEIHNILPEGVQFAVIDGPVVADGYTWVQVWNETYGAGWCAASFLVVL